MSGKAPSFSYAADQSWMLDFSYFEQMTFPVGKYLKQYLYSRSQNELQV